MNVLVISGSTRRESFNARLARLVRDLRPQDDVILVSNLSALPFYNADVEAIGWPEDVAGLRSAVEAADVVVLVTPEYNGTVPGVLANAVDWLSRPAHHSVLRGKPVLVLSASPSGYGGVRAAGHLREVLRRIGAEVADVGLSVPRADQRLTDPVDPEVVDQLAGVLVEVLDAVPVAEPALAA